MPYNPKYNEKSYEYRKKNLRRVSLDFPNDYYDNVLMPAVEASGLGKSGFIKAAITEKLQRDA